MDAYVPLLQTVAWVGLIAGTLIAFRRALRQVVGAVGTRVSSGADLRLGVAGFQLELGRELPRLPPSPEGAAPPPSAARAPTVTPEGLPAPSRAGPARGLPGPGSSDADAVAAWTHERDRLKENVRGVHLAHVIGPTTVPDQKFDVFVYLVESRDGHLAQVRRAEFFLGRHWGNRIFEVANNGERIGFSTSAYGPTLCLCRVEFVDGHEVVLSRYLDFEMAPLVATTPVAAAA